MFIYTIRAYVGMETSPRFMFGVVASNMAAALAQAAEDLPQLGEGETYDAVTVDDDGADPEALEATRLKSLAASGIDPDKVR